MSPITTTLSCVLVALLIGAFGGYSHGVSTERARGDAAMAKHMAEDHKEAADEAERVTDTNIDITEAVAAAADEAYKKGFQDAEDARARLVADLRAGNVQLREYWAGCETDRLAQSAASALELGRLARDREESAGRIVQAADQCDAQVIGLQTAYNGAKAIIDKHNEGSSRR